MCECFTKATITGFLDIIHCEDKKKVTLSLRLTKQHAMKTCAGVDVYIHIFFIWALFGGEWSASRPCRLTPGEGIPGIHWVGGWVGPRAGLEDVLSIVMFLFKTFR
jgi:hypothetical protein